MEILILIWVIVGGLVGLLAGRARGRESEGVKIGAVLGPIGWLIMLCSHDKRLRCIECGGVVVEGARKCLHCGSVIERKFDIRCPACGERGQMRESLMGEEIECPTCKRVFRPTSARV